MSVVSAGDAQEFAMHGAVFTSYVRPQTGAGLCAWQLALPEGSVGVPHRPSNEEVLVVLEGEIDVELDGTLARASVGDAVHVPAAALFAVSAPRGAARAWVTTSAGLRATLPDGSVAEPPWAQPVMMER